MKFKWNLRVMMAQHDIRSAAELMRQLKNVGVDISPAQTTRIVNELPSRINTNVLMGLVKIFKCSVGDLIIVDHDEGNEVPASNVRKLHGEKNPELPKKVQTPASKAETKPKPEPKPKPKSKPVEDISSEENVSSLTGGKARPYTVKGRDE